MNHSLLVFLPGLLDFDHELSFVGNTESGIWQSARIHQIKPLPQEENLLLSMLGLRAEGLSELLAGPLRIAGSRTFPPQTSTCWALDLLSLNKSGEILSATIPSKDEQRWLDENVGRLTQKRLQIFHNYGLQWSSVIENGSPEYSAKSPIELYGQPLAGNMPDGEDQKLLVSIVENSANLLLESPFNVQRIDRGEPPLSFFLPWGGGFMPRLPNLSFKYAQPIEILADEAEWHGIASLVRCQYRVLQNPIVPDWSQFAPKNQSRIAISHAFIQYRKHNQLERAEQLWHTFSKQLLEPIVQQINPETTWKVALCSYDPIKGGLLAEWSAMSSHQRVPFHERTMGDPNIAQYQLCESVQSFWQ